MATNLTRKRRTYVLDGELTLEATPDRGCSAWPSCVSCPFVRCIAELPQTQRVEFYHAWRTVLAHIAPPDGTLPGR